MIRCKKLPVWTCQHCNNPNVPNHRKEACDSNYWCCLHNVDRQIKMLKSMPRLGYEDEDKKLNT